MAGIGIAADAGRLRVAPGGPLRGEFTPPGDKSITHRALIFGALAGGEIRIENPNPGADCASTFRCLESLGVRGMPSGFSGPGIHDLEEPEQPLDCGNSGTTMRLLAGVAASRPFLTVLVGDSSLHRRPMARVIEPLRQMGASLWARDADRLPPLVVRGASMRPVHYVLPVASAQVATCVLIAALAAAGRTKVEIPGPARDHTERLLPALGVPLEITPFPGGGRRVVLAGPAIPRAARIRVAGDFSAAAFFLSAAAARPGASVTARGVNLNPTRTALLEALEAMGAGVEHANLRDQSGEPVGDVTVTGPDRLRAFDVPPIWLPRMVDEVPAWAMAAAVAEGTSRLSGAAELRAKESDRLSALAANLNALGVRTEEWPDGLAIAGGEVRGGTVQARSDHRIAMAFATLGTLSREGITVEGASTIATSYPGFRETLVALGGEVPGESRAAQWT